MNKQLLATLVVEIPSVNGSATHHHQVLEWEHKGEKARIIMVLPVVEHPDAPTYMPLRVVSMHDGVQSTLWERNWSSGTFPYLCDVEEQVVIACLRQGKVVKVIALSTLMTDEHLDTAGMIALKRATAEELNLPPEFSREEHEVMELLAEAGANTVVATSEAEAALTPVVAAPKSDMAEQKTEKAKAELAKKRPIKVYDKKGKKLKGIPVHKSEYKLCQHGVQYVTLNRCGEPENHFTMEWSENGRYRTTNVVLVSAQDPLRPTAHSYASEGASPTVH